MGQTKQKKKIKTEKNSRQRDERSEAERKNGEDKSHVGRWCMNVLEAKNCEKLHEILSLRFIEKEEDCTKIFQANFQRKMHSIKMRCTQNTKRIHTDGHRAESNVQNDDGCVGGDGGDGHGVRVLYTNKIKSNRIKGNN